MFGINKFKVQGYAIVIVVIATINSGLRELLV